MEMESSLSSMTFKGSVTEAITEAKHQRKLLVVYISGDDADTSSLERYTLRSLNLRIFFFVIVFLATKRYFVVRFLSKYCIFLHLPAESASGLQFSSIYPQKSIPSITVVGFEGVKLWQHDGYIDPKALASSLGECLNLCIKEPTAFVETTSFASKSFEVATNSTPGSSTSTSSESRTSSGPTLLSEDRLQIPEHKPNPTSQKVDDVHLSIRLVNGCSLQEKFSLTSTLQMVKEYVDNNQGADFGSYDLAIRCPLKVFDYRDLSMSLSELGLFHRQALIVIPRQRPGIAGEGGFFYSKRANSKKTDDSAENGDGYFAFVKWILSYANPFAYLGRSASDPDSYPSSPNQSSSSGRSGLALATSQSGSNIHTIHTLKNDKDDDERPSNRNTFWNGNSTLYGGDDGEAK